MRALIRSVLIADIPEEVQIPADRWFGSGSIQGIPETYFAEIKFGGRFRGLSTVQRRRLEVWVHGPEGDYDELEKILKFVRDRLDGLEHKTDSDGNEIILCTWVNDSTDLYDDGYRTNCMMSSFDIVGKEAS